MRFVSGHDFQSSLNKHRENIWTLAAGMPSPSYPESALTLPLRTLHSAVILTLTLSVAKGKRKDLHFRLKLPHRRCPARNLHHLRLALHGSGSRGVDS